MYNTVSRILGKKMQCYTSPCVTTVCVATRREKPEPEEPEAYENAIYFRCDDDLKAWIVKQAEKMPRRRRSGASGRMSDYVRSVLEAHRKGERFETPLPDKEVIRWGKEVLSFGPVGMRLALYVGHLARHELGESVDEAAEDLLSQLGHTQTERPSTEIGGTRDPGTAEPPRRPRKKT